MNISVIGTGYVGLVTGACFAEFGIRVTCVDKDAGKIERLEAGEIPIFEPGLEEIVRRNTQAGLLSFTTDAERAVQDSLVIFIAVPTPPAPDGSTDLSYVDEVARTIGAHLDGYKVVVTKSTVPVKTAERVRKTIAEAAAAAGRSDVRCSVASNPEFLREGSAVEDFLRPDRVVIGAEDPEAIAILKDLYKPLNLIEVPFVITNVATAELIKYASNAFLATKISFINEISTLVRGGRRRRARRLARDGPRRPDRPQVPAPGPGLRRLVLPEGHAVAGAVQPRVRRRAAHRRGDRPRQRGAARAHDRQDREARRQARGRDDRRARVCRSSPTPTTCATRPRSGSSRSCAGAARTSAATTRRRWRTPRASSTARCSARTPTTPPRAATRWSSRPSGTSSASSTSALLKERLRQPVIVDLRNICEPAEMKRLGFRYSGVGR